MLVAIELSRARGPVAVNEGGTCTCRSRDCPRCRRRDVSDRPRRSFQARTFLPWKRWPTFSTESAVSAGHDWLPGSPLSGARTAMMPGTMTSQGPMTRANARVRALDSALAGMGIPSSVVREALHSICGPYRICQAKWKRQKLPRSRRRCHAARPSLMRSACRLRCWY